MSLQLVHQNDGNGADSDTLGHISSNQDLGFN